MTSGVSTRATGRGGRHAGWRLAIALTAIGLGAALAADARAETETFECRHAERERRVALRFADDADRVPCEVLYWRDALRDDVPQVLWSAQSDAGFCQDKADDLIGRLEDAGWTCDAAEAEPVQAAPPDEPARREPAREPEDAPARAESEPGLGEAAGEPQEPAADLRSAELRLRDAIDRDVERLNQLTDSGHFELIMTDLGDSDQDEVEDAAAIMSFRSNGKLSHYLIAYVFDGGTFRPVAKTYLGGNDSEVRSGEIERIEDGAIRLRLRVVRSGDPACCPSGERRAAFVLEDGKLVEAPVS